MAGWHSQCRKGHPALVLAGAAALGGRPRLAEGVDGAIDYAAGLIRTNGYEGARKIIDVSGDGPQIGGRPVEAARDEAALPFPPRHRDRFPFQEPRDRRARLEP